MLIKALINKGDVNEIEIF